MSKTGSAISGSPFHLTAGLAAAAFRIVLEPGVRLPMVGARGAVSDVLGAISCTGRRRA